MDKVFTNEEVDRMNQLIQELKDLLDNKVDVRSKKTKKKNTYNNMVCVIID